MIATAIEEEAAAFCRRRFHGTADYLEAKDEHCKRVAALVRQLRPLIGVPPALSLGTGRRQSGRYQFEVVARARKAAARA
ncbi:hypothetical protein [Methylobacterium soli]|uniref:hypothetical protein n=1 Tax=Methylobacterium soli TaxID=553447 RepID=UPI001EE292E5|nr:hypothetical protein [Methylobacterium soli]